jgi:hypothetical protein
MAQAVEMHTWWTLAGLAATSGLAMAPAQWNCKACEQPLHPHRAAVDFDIDSRSAAVNDMAGGTLATAVDNWHCDSSDSRRIADTAGLPLDDLARQENMLILSEQRQGVLTGVWAAQPM